MPESPTFGRRVRETDTPVPRKHVLKLPSTAPPAHHHVLQTVFPTNRFRLSKSFEGSDRLPSNFKLTTSTGEYTFCFHGSYLIFIMICSPWTSVFSSNIQTESTFFAYSGFVQTFFFDSSTRAQSFTSASLLTRSTRLFPSVILVLVGPRPTWLITLERSPSQVPNSLSLSSSLPLNIYFCRDSRRLSALVPTSP